MGEVPLYTHNTESKLQNPKPKTRTLDPKLLTINTYFLQGNLA